jgi:2-polyprenyl-3-methyl-5-hydroxy-6-metoxy-1,4-benzoquinol methylase
VEPNAHSTEGYDRYKASSLRAYNVKLPDRYDRGIALKVLRVSVMDDFVLGELGSDLEELRILDVGCATGRLLERLAAAGATRLAGSDLAPRIVEVARGRLSDQGIAADLKPADAESRLPWPADAFDVVTMTGVLHHFLHPEAALGEIGRVLRPAGRFVLSDACFFPPAREIMNLALLVHPHEGDCRFYTPRQAAGLLTACGWDVQVSRRLNWWAYGAVAVRGSG